MYRYGRIHRCTGIQVRREVRLFHGPWADLRRKHDLPTRRTRHIAAEQVVRQSAHHRGTEQLLMLAQELRPVGHHSRPRLTVAAACRTSGVRRTLAVLPDGRRSAADGSAGAQHLLLARARDPRPRDSRVGRAETAADTSADQRAGSGG